MKEDPPPIFVIMGPAGCGKTTVGRHLAERCALPFVDADEFHSALAIEKMSRGEPLSDADRAPWLQRLAKRMARAEKAGLVLACSALKQIYRDELGMNQPGRHLVYLRVPSAELTRRLQARTTHFAGVDLLESQLAALQLPDPAEIYDGTASPEDIATAVISRVGFPLDWTSDQSR